MSNELSIIDYDIIFQSLLYSILVYNINNKNKNKSINDIILDLKDSKDKFYLNKYLINNINNDKIIKVFFSKTTHILCIIIKNDKEKKIKIIFKGTTDNIHLEYNLKINLRKIKFLENNIKIHDGFYQQLFKDNFYYKIIKYIKKLNINNDYFLFFSGHSLGGVMASLFGYFSSFIFDNNKIVVISFGSCKIGNKYFQESFNNKNNLICYRIINENDIIINLPLLKYEHIGIPIKLNSNINYDIIYNHKYETYLKNLLISKW